MIFFRKFIKFFSPMFIIFVRMKAKTKSILLGIILITTISFGSVGAGFYFHNNIIIRGTITHLSFEGGFYGIISTTNKSYDPINLPPEFEEEGLKVFVIARRNLEMVSGHGWGELIEIRYIKQI